MIIILKVNIGDETYNFMIRYNHSETFTKTALAQNTNLAMDA